MAEPDVSYGLTGQAVAFVGISLQLAAVLWIWRDWKLSQYQHPDWRRAHRQDESETLKGLRVLWGKFGGPASAVPVDWDSLDSVELERMSKEFPAFSDDETLTKRKIGAVSQRYGIGPSDAELRDIGGTLQHLAVLRRGVPDYRTFVRRRTFKTALQLMIAGFALQLLGSWPERWITIESSPKNTTTTDPARSEVR